jgi:hypothetical protein
VYDGFARFFVSSRSLNWLDGVKTWRCLWFAFLLCTPSDQK